MVGDGESEIQNPARAAYAHAHALRESSFREEKA